MKELKEFFKSIIKETTKIQYSNQSEFKEFLENLKETLNFLFDCFKKIYPNVSENENEINFLIKNF